MAVAQVPFALVEALLLDERQAYLLTVLERDPSELTGQAGRMAGWPAGGVVK